MIAESARWGTIPTSPGPVAQHAGRLAQRGQLHHRHLHAAADRHPALAVAGGRPLSQLVAPEFYVNGVDEYGGTFNPGDQLTISAANLPAGAVIYYTLDGTDPRLLGGAVQHRRPTCSCLLRPDRAHARRRRSGAGLFGRHLERHFRRPTFTVESAIDPDHRIDVLALPPPRPPKSPRGYTSVDGREDFEFIEITNTGAQTLAAARVAIHQRSHVHISECVDRRRVHYMVVASDTAAFAIRYGAATANRIRQQLAEPDRRRAVHRPSRQRRRRGAVDAAQRRRSARLHLQSRLVFADRRRRILAHGPRHQQNPSRSGTRPPAGSPAASRAARPAPSKRHSDSAARFDRHQRSAGQSARRRRRHDRAAQHHRAADQHRRLVAQRQQCEPARNTRSPPIR